MKKPYFFGVYYRFTDTQAPYSMAVIVGIHIKNNQPRAFIQVTDTKNRDSYYIHYSHKDFFYSDNPFFIKCENNIFTKEFVYLNIDQPRLHLHGLLTFKNNQDINRSTHYPTIMGPFGYLPLPCQHSIYSMFHHVNGVMSFNGGRYYFHDSAGYMEGDRGNVMPREYLWLQSNTFNNKDDIHFMCAYATIPLPIKGEFKGLICVLHINGKEHRFATYNGGFMEHFIREGNDYMMAIRKGKYRLLIKATLVHPKPLFAPNNRGMQRVIKEDLKGKIDIEFYKGKTCLCRLKDEHCAIESTWKNHEK